ncbi:MAG: DNA-3-methyladenine glycosylase 2 family protein [Actinomycetota bacterium]|nr:DNA-3-methyladenine glycosylase 2 family protein [Actinomycetota bacterium]
MVTVHAPARQPFDFGASLRFIGRFPATAGEQSIDDGVLTCALRASGVLVGARITAEGDGLRYELASASPLDDEAVLAASDRLSFHLGLDDDLAAFYALAADDPPFQGVFDALYGYHQVLFPSPLELMCWAILAQRVPMAGARKMKRAIVTAAGNRIVVNGAELWAFPDLGQLLGHSPDDLVDLIGNRRKAGYLHAAFRQWEEIDEAFLRHGKPDQVRERLLAIPGIGPWSATFLMVRGLGRSEEISADGEAKLAASRVYGRTLTDAEFAELAGRYGQWQGYWAHYLRAAG